MVVFDRRPIRPVPLPSAFTSPMPRRNRPPSVGGGSFFLCAPRRAVAFGGEVSSAESPFCMAAIRSFIDVLAGGTAASEAPGDEAPSFAPAGLVTSAASLPASRSALARSGAWSSSSPSLASISAVISSGIVSMFLSTKCSTL